MHLESTIFFSAVFYYLINSSNSIDSNGICCFIFVKQATTEVPFDMLPDRIRHFFGNEILNCSQSRSLGHKVPQFSLQLDGKFDHDKVISSFAASLTKDLAQYFIQSHHSVNHVHVNSVEAKAYDVVDGGATQVSQNKSSHESPLIPVGLTNKTLKGKSSLQLAISTFGYQILCYPHFAELCWYTSKLKEGPCANASGSWKGWPFNSCIVRPINSTEEIAASSLSNIRSKECGSVRGLVAVGLSAYRGEYNSLREVCSGVRKVLEALVRLIDDKIQAGKDRTQFIRLLSQVAYLEDMVSCWAHALQRYCHISYCFCSFMSQFIIYFSTKTRTTCSSGVDAHSQEANADVLVGKANNHIRDSVSEGDGHKICDLNVKAHELEVLENNFEEGAPVDASHSSQTDLNNGSANAGDDVAVAVTVEEPFHKVISVDTCSPKRILEPTDVSLQSSMAEVVVPNGVNIESPKAENGGDHAQLKHAPSTEHSNGFTESSLKFSADGPYSSVDKHSALAETGIQTNVLPTENGILSVEENSGGRDLNTNCSSGPESPQSSSGAICSYQCCPDCFVTLNDKLLRIINIEWKSKGSESTVEDVHDFVASLSANLHLSLSKSCQGEIPCARHCTCRKSITAKMPDLDNLEKPLMMDCDCHATSHEKTPEGSRRFVFKDGVLMAANLDTRGTEVSYHCKYEKLCLCFLIEWLVTSKGSH